MIESSAQAIGGFFSRIGESVGGFLTQTGQNLAGFFTGWGAGSLFVLISRYVLAVLAISIVARCLRSLLAPGRQLETWGILGLPGGVNVPINHWENAVGRAASCDIRLNYPAVSRNHAVLIRDDDGSWSLSDLGSKGGIQINGIQTGGKSPVSFGDVISFAGVDTILLSPENLPPDEQKPGEQRPAVPVGPGVSFLFLTLFQLLAALQLCMSAQQLLLPVLLVYGGLIALQWLYFILMRLLRRIGFEVEILAFFLSSIGLGVMASAAINDLYKQFAALLLGLAIFIALGLYMRDLKRTRKTRWVMAAGALGLFAVNLIFGQTVNGAKNWLDLGFITFQPSELIKIAFVYAGAAALDRLLQKRNLTLFIAFSGACVGALALMSDFGTASVFFVAFLVIAFLRSGDLATISLSCAGAVFAAMLAVKFRPYIAQRFSTWRHAWEYANSGGYQQTRTLSAAASGGLFGMGAGNGWLKGIAAGNTDLVFGMVCEEWGLITAVCAVTAIAALAVFTVKSAPAGRSSFYVISACAAASMLVFQTGLNVFGSVDILPLTGVTFPFVSGGGSSMLSSWGLLAFIKAADTRKNASFAIKLPRRKQKTREKES